MVAAVEIANVSKSYGDVEVLVDALADFGAARRASLLEAGQPVTKPSDRKTSARRRKAE